MGKRGWVAGKKVHHLNSTAPSASAGKLTTAVNARTIERENTKHHLTFFIITPFLGKTFEILNPNLKTPDILKFHLLSFNFLQSSATSTFLEWAR